MGSIAHKLGATMVVGLAVAPAAAQDLPCRAHLVPCNLAHHFSGSVSWTSAIESVAGKTTETVTVHVARGKARCEGSVASTDPGATSGRIAGEGLVVLETGIGTDEDDAAPWYRLAVACPGVDGVPAAMNGSEMSSYKQPRSGSLARVQGSREEEHPDADPVNGVTGTLLLRWSLAQEGGAAPAAR